VYLFFDTETTGLPRNWRAPVEDLSNWPRMVQLAYLLYDDEGSLLSGADHIIVPDGFVIPADASGIHGITHEKALREGKPLAEVLNIFLDCLGRSDTIVAHNISFDEKIVGAELLRHGMTNMLPEKNRICTMLGSTEFCQLPGPYGYKWPKLAELYRFLFNTDFVDAHNAAEDIKVTAQCFWELRRKGVV